MKLEIHRPSAEVQVLLIILNFLCQCSTGNPFLSLCVNLTADSKWKEEGIVVSATCPNLRSEDSVTWASSSFLSGKQIPITCQRMKDLG